MALRNVLKPLRSIVLRYNNLSSSILVRNFDIARNFSFVTSPGRLLIATEIGDIMQKRYAKKAIVKEQKGKKAKPKVELSEEEMMEVINVTVFQSQLQNVLNKLKQNYTEHLSLHTGVGSIESIMVKIDDEEYPLNQIAQISRKGSNLAVLNLSSFPEGLKPTLQAIQESGMNLNPQQDGTLIYVPLPKITREHRENLAINAKILLNQAKEELRQIHNKYVKEAKKNLDLSEDLIFNCQQQIKLMVQNTIDEGEKMMLNKQKELLSER